MRIRTMVSLEEDIDKKLKGFLVRKYGDSGHFKSYTINRAIEEFLQNRKGDH